MGRPGPLLAHVASPARAYYHTTDWSTGSPTEEDLATYRMLDPEREIEAAAGGATLSVVHGSVRWIRVAGVETVRGIYGALRAPDWATIEPRFASYEGWIGDDAFEVRFRAECIREAGAFDFVWEGTISGTRDGTVRYSLDGICRSAFLTPRIGLCVLHPPRLAGQPAQVGTLFGTLDGHFPDLVTPYMPFSNMLSLHHDAGTDHETVIDLEGDAFETEDQRAFTDASFKTFSRPLELPQPYRVEHGAVVRQAVTVRHPRLSRRGRLVPSHARYAGTSVVRVLDTTGRPFPAIGSCLPPGDLHTDRRVSEAVGALGLAHLRMVVDVSAADAHASVDRGASVAAEAGAALEVLLVASADDARIETIVDRLAQTGTEVVRLMAVDADDHTTTAPLAIRVRAAMQSAGLDIPLVGGTRGYLYQLISSGVPGAHIDLVSYPTNPQVHAFDEASIAETIEVLAAGVRTAAAVAGGKAVAVGPVSLRPLFNPDLVAPEAPPPAGELPWRYDPRQVGRFNAAWTLGSASAFAAAGVVALTLHEAAGWGGLIAANHMALPEMPFRPGSMMPVGRVVSALASLAGANSLRVESAPPIHAVAVREAGGSTRVLVSNLGGSDREVLVDIGRDDIGPAAVSLLSADGDDGATWRLETATGRAVSLSPAGVASLVFGQG